MIVGTEWLIEAEGCDANKLRDAEVLRAVFSRLIDDLNLKTVGESIWHKFPGAGGVTGLIALTESHLACHTYPEYRIATFNLYCCRERAAWNWEENLRETLGAEIVTVQKIERGGNTTSSNPESRIQNLKSLEVQFERFAGKLSVVRRAARIQIRFDRCFGLSVLPFGGCPNRPRS
jgi:S-adenosylmethionine decarboxylase